jgi:hypothetical protein
VFRKDLIDEVTKLRKYVVETTYEVKTWVPIEKYTLVAQKFLKFGIFIGPINMNSYIKVTMQTQTRKAQKK